MLLKHWENWHPSHPGCNIIIPLINTFLLNLRTNTNYNQTLKRLSSLGYRIILLISINIKKIKIKNNNNLETEIDHAVY